MIYSNIAYKSKLDTEFNKQRIYLGETGKGLACFQPLALKAGENPEYSVKLSKLGRPRIVLSSGDETTYLLLSGKKFSPENGRKKRANRFVFILNTQLNAVRVLISSSGNNGANWDSMLIQIEDPNIPVLFRVGLAMEEEKYSEVYLSYQNHVYKTTLSDLEDLFEKK